MISLVLPYWQRQAAADAALRSLAACYAGLDLEVIVVDDGSPQPYVAPLGLPFEVRVRYLPKKAGPLNPCTPLNAGAAAARGEYIAFSCAEILHSSLALPTMLGELTVRGRKCYVTAACRSEGKWHAHTSLLPVEIEGQPMPAGYHFLAMMHRELWLASGGFDADYRAGAGYEDADFLLRVQRAGAKFVMRDDIVVEHPRTGVRAAWTREMHERNRLVFRAKWCSPSQR